MNYTCRYLYGGYTTAFGKELSCSGNLWPIHSLWYRRKDIRQHTTRFDGHSRFKIDTFGSVLENNAGNRRLDGGIIVKIAFQYHKFIIGAEAQMGLVKINQQLRQVIDTKEFRNYLPKNFASFFTIGYKFR